MKAIGKYVRECCGKRLAGKHRFCPVCGAKANRPACDPATLAILMEIDKRARTNDTQAEKLRERLRRIEAGDESAIGRHASDLSTLRCSTEKTLKALATSTAWYCSVEALINNLLEDKR